jgi:hypothetical protein
VRFDRRRRGPRTEIWNRFEELTWKREPYGGNVRDADELAQDAEKHPVKVS